jgi:hypothetical protein
MEVYKRFGDLGQLATHHGIVNSNSGNSFTTFHGFNNVNPGFSGPPSLANPYVQKSSILSNPSSNLTIPQ